MSDSVLALYCGCGAMIEASWNHKPDWAQLTGFGSCVEWSEDGVCAGEHWARSDTQPIQGDLYILRVRSPFTITVADQPVWVVWQPALSYVNGWEGLPEEIRASCLVQIKLRNVLEIHRTYAWISVEAQRVIPFTALAETVPSSRGKDLCPLFEQILPDGYYKERAGELTFITVNAQGDIGAWMICGEWNSSPVLLLYCEWSFHEDELYIGHRPLTDQEWERLTSPEPHPANLAH